MAQMIRKTEEAAHGVLGVLDVANDLAVEGAARTGADIARAVRIAREAVVGAIRGTPGVCTVDDKLRIEPFSI